MVREGWGGGVEVAGLGIDGGVGAIGGGSRHAIRVGGEFEPAALEGGEPRGSRGVVDCLEQRVGDGGGEGRAEVAQAEVVELAGSVAVDVLPVRGVTRGSRGAGLFDNRVIRLDGRAPGARRLPDFAGGGVAVGGQVGEDTGTEQRGDGVGGVAEGEVWRRVVEFGIGAAGVAAAEALALLAPEAEQRLVRLGGAVDEGVDGGVERVVLRGLGGRRPPGRGPWCAGRISGGSCWCRDGSR